VRNLTSQKLTDVKNYAQTCTSGTLQTLKLSKPGPQVSLKKEQQPPVGSTKPDAVWNGKQRRHGL